MSDIQLIVKRPMMKTIISGRRYDTETATEVVHTWSGCSQGDFKCLSETIYRTAAGNWFLAAKGGALTKYAEIREPGKSRYAGEAVVSLTPVEAREWLEANGKTEALETHFSSETRNAQLKLYHELEAVSSGGTPTIPPWGEKKKK